MFVVLFHMLYLLGKCVYNSYRERKVNTPSNDGADEETADSQHVLEDNKVEVATYVAQPLLSGPQISMKFSPPAYIQRYLAVADILSSPKYGKKLRKIVDFGCSELGLLPYVKNLEGVKELLFIDVDREVLEDNKIKAAPLVGDFMKERFIELKIELLEGSVIHNDKKLERTDAVICIELIEHLYPSILSKVPDNIFGYIKPKLVIVTTPNAEFNVLFPLVNEFRHPDHKFEWTRKQFEDWAKGIVKKYPFYSVKFEGICYGPESTKHLGAVSQMAIFELNEELSVRSPQTEGVEGLFQTVETYIYHCITDDRTDTEKVMGEVTYYINFLTIQSEDSSPDEVDLIKLHKMLKCSLSLESLREIMIDHGYVIEDRENGLVVILSQESDHETDDESVASLYSSGDTFIDDDPFDNERLLEIYNNMNGDDMYEEDVYTNYNWNEESIVIAASQVDPSHENSYLFNGEHSTDHNHHRSLEQWDTDVGVGDAHSTFVHTAEITDVFTVIGNREEAICEEAVLNERDPCASDTSETNNVTEVGGCIVTPAITSSSLQATSQYVGTNLSSVQDNDDVVSSFRPYLSVSRSSTSPGLLFNPELDDSLISQSLLNNTFHRSDVPSEAVTMVKLSAGTPLMNEVLSSEDNGEVDCSEHASLSYLKGNSDSIQQNNVSSMKHQALEDTPNESTIQKEVQNTFSILYDKPQSTSSPRCNKLRTTCTADIVNQIVSTKKNGHLHDGEHSTDFHCLSEELIAVSDVDVGKCSNREEFTVSIKKSCLEGNDLISALESYTELIPTETVNAVTSDTDALKNTSQESLCSDNIVTGTVHRTISENKNVISKRETDANCLSSDNSQQELYLENEIANNDHFTSVGSLREDGNETNAGKENLIKYETDVVDVQRVDTHCVFSSDDVHEEYACRESKVAAIKPCDDDTETRLQNGSKVLAHPSDKSLSPFRQLPNTKSWSTRECSSSMCAKENNDLDDSFKSCDEDTNHKVVQFASPLRSDENVGCDTKDSTSKDVNTSNVAGLIAGTEVKLPSPAFESPPDSWSHEIVDSGYPNSASGQDITPENDLSSIAQDHIPDMESPSIAEAPRLGILEPVEVENGDLANNNRDDEGNNMMAADAANDIEGLQPLIDVLENDLENENDIYVLENGFPMWLLRILDMANPLDFDVQPRQNLRVHHADVDYMDHDEGFDSSSSDE